MDVYVSADDVSFAEAFSVILGTKEKIIKSGSTLKLVCALKRATEAPQYIFW